MATSQRGKIQVELGRTLTDYTLMTDSGDHQTFTAGTIYSGKSGYAPDVRPNGIVTGQQLLSTHATADTVTIAGFTAHSAGTLFTVAASSIAVTRPSTSTHKISSIIMDDAGALDEVEGSESTAFSTTRGSAGGPPLIPVDAVEIGQVRMSAQASAVIDETEIYQDMGDHAEYADYPTPEISNMGDGSYATASSQVNAYVKFNAAFPLSHTGPAAKRVYVKYYTPTLSDLLRTVDFVPAETGITKTSQTTYEGSGVSGAIGSMKADTITDASFTVFAGDAITDAILREKNQYVTVKWFPDASKTPYLLTQGLLGVVRSFPAGNQNKITCTVYAEKASVEFSS